MQTICDECDKSIKEVGRLTNVKFSGYSQKVCKDCRKKIKMTYR